MSASPKRKFWNLWWALWCWLDYSNYLYICYEEETAPIQFSEWVRDYEAKNNIWHTK